MSCVYACAELETIARERYDCVYATCEMHVAGAARSATEIDSVCLCVCVESNAAREGHHETRRFQQVRALSASKGSGEEHSTGLRRAREL